MALGDMLTELARSLLPLSIHYTLNLSTLLPRQRESHMVNVSAAMATILEDLGITMTMTTIHHTSDHSLPTQRQATVHGLVGSQHQHRHIILEPEHVTHQGRLVRLSIRDMITRIVLVATTDILNLRRMIANTATAASHRHHGNPNQATIILLHKAQRQSQIAAMTATINRVATVSHHRHRADRETHTTLLLHAAQYQIKSGTMTATLGGVVDTRKHHPHADLEATTVTTLMTRLAAGLQNTLVSPHQIGRLPQASKHSLSESGKGRATTEI